MDTPDQNNRLDSSKQVDLPTPPPTSSYFEKLLAMIPGDMVAGYLCVDGILREAALDAPIWLYWAVTIAMLTLTPLYVLYKPTPVVLMKHSKTFNAVTATVAFAVWIFALGGAFAVTWPDLYRPLYGSLLLVVTTLAIPVLDEMASRFNFFR